MSLAPPPAGEVDVWWARTGGPALAGRVLGALSPDELERADAFRFGRDRSRFVGRRGLLRHLLGAYLGIGASELRFAYGESGKPSLPGLEFNASSSGGVAVIAVARGPLGVDVERLSEPPEAAAIVRRVCSTGEAREFSALGGRRRLVAFCRLWTAKEAVLKGLGTGLAGCPEGIEVLAGGGELHQSWGDWKLREITPACGFIACVAARTPHFSSSIRLLTLDSLTA